MAISSADTVAAPVAPDERKAARSTLATTGTAHALHDGFSDAVYLFLPVWQAELGLTLAQTGIMKAAYSLGMSSLQVPASVVAEKFGERTVLGLGTMLLGLGYLLAGWAGGFVALAGAMMLTGIGSSVQHPLSSTLISRSATGARLRVALSTYNFLGDIGKVLVPSLAAFMIVYIGWRGTISILGAIGIGIGVGIIVMLRPGRITPIAKDPAKDQGAATSDWRKFGTLATISLLDSAGRAGALTLLPFVLTTAGAELSTIGIALSLTFAGGAAGKFVCGLLAIRFGIVGTVVVTEIMTAICIVALPFLPLVVILPLLPLLGVALNGTSSVLYGSVPETVAKDRIARAFGIFYTFSMTGGAVAPFLFGFLSDQLTLGWALRILAIAILLIVRTAPLTLTLRLRHARGQSQ